MLLCRRRWLVLLGLTLGLVLTGAAVAPVAVAKPRLPDPADWPLSGRPQVVRDFDEPDQKYGPGHRGVDLAARTGQPVLAAAAGTVTFAGSVGGRGVVSIDHGGVGTTYEPVEPHVTAGQRVSLGQQIGLVSNGGHCAGSCLHWGLRQAASYADPLLMVRRTGGPLRLLAAADREVAVGRVRARAEMTAASGTAGIGPVATAALGGAGGHGFIHPVPGGITSAYGMRFHPVLRRWKLHDGTDFGAACGTPIHAPYAGVVSRAYFNTGYGNRLILDHGTVDGVHVQTALNHATRYVVRPGHRVARGQMVGFVGSTGYSTGCHLHLMVWLNGRMVDPMTWL